jgi:hypothetical protein
MRMVLGNYIFSRNPNRCGLLTPVRHTATVQTYGGVAFFSWGLMTIGKQVRLEWDLCEDAQYNAMEALYLTDAPVLWNPKDGSGKSYSVEITVFEAQLFMYLKAKPHWLKNVQMDLLILDEGTVI